MIGEIKVKAKAQKKKKESNSALIKRLRGELAKWRENYYDEVNENSTLRSKIATLEKYLTKKFYRIKYKIRANDKQIWPCDEIVTGYSPEHAIDQLKKNKTYPDTFVLTDIQLLA